ncbi:DNA-binding response regulator [Candidatus Parcubacteria bacterium]|nr:MAG: DNA-binding response regulator [Candidatus Parcubacteria bacterium]
MSRPKILIVLEDAYLAGIYGRKFENDQWEVKTAENIKDGENIVVSFRPDIAIISADNNNLPNLIQYLKGLPTWQKTKIVVLAKDSERYRIEQALSAGADEYLLIGHFVPMEVVKKMRKLL